MLLRAVSHDAYPLGNILDRLWTSDDDSGTVSGLTSLMREIQMVGSPANSSLGAVVYSNNSSAKSKLKNPPLAKGNYSSRIFLSSWNIPIRDRDRTRDGPRSSVHDTRHVKPYAIGA
ncbi:hypothetical protein ElyMa_001287800 [Elysia marginata]|uniref:Uncharacterized protein n=1 Tax=Elysia marginata TaxID=1093978 RepID=A0AAV4IHD4_9GAST|nr:hypothetical protein ElyMa_001287800 [Elysia marginata]